MMHMRVDGQVYVTVGSCGCWSFELARTGAPQAVVSSLIGCYEITPVNTVCVLFLT